MYVLINICIITACVGGIAMIYFGMVKDMVSVVLGGLGCVFLACFGLVIRQGVENITLSDLCRERGGVAIFGDRGHYKICVDKKYIIDMDT